MSFEEDIQRFQRLVERRMEVVVPIAIRSMYRQFLDLEPVWTGMLAFNYTFSIGQPASGTVDVAFGGMPPAPRGMVLSGALSYYLNSVPDKLPVGGTFFITNNLDYSMKIERDGSPFGYGQNALQYTINDWKVHVTLGVADAVMLVTP